MRTDRHGVCFVLILNTTCRLVSCLKHDISATRLSLLLQAEITQFGPIDKANLSLSLSLFVDSSTTLIEFIEPIHHKSQLRAGFVKLTGIAAFVRRERLGLAIRPS